MNTVKKLSWKAVRRGEVYCAPACGGGCTRGAFELATKRAAALVQRMGKGWKPDVWENLGWHYAVISPCGRIKLHVSHYPLPPLVTYTAFLGEKDSGGGTWVAHSEIPKAAVQAVIAKAKASLARMGATLVGL